MRIQDLLYDLEHTEGGAPVSGTGETPGGTSGSPAGAENSDTGQGGSPPDTIPYSRFKEVNDQLAELRGFKALADVGYDADSLRQLADFEAGFQRDPVQTWLSIAGNIEQLPQEVKEAIERHQNAPSGGSGDAARQGQGDDVPEWAKSLSQKVEGLTEVEQQRRQREANEASNAILDRVMGAWRQMDEGEGLKPLSDERMLTYIIAHSRSTDSPEALLKAAREEYMGVREEAIGSAMPRPGGNAGAPRSVPGSGAPPNMEEPPKTLAEASLRAKARLEMLESQQGA